MLGTLAQSRPYSPLPGVLGLIRVCVAALLVATSSAVAQSTGRATNDAQAAGDYTAFRVLLRDRKAACAIADPDYHELDSAAERLLFDLYNKNYGGRGAPSTSQFYDLATRRRDSVVRDPVSYDLSPVCPAVLKEIKAFHPNAPAPKAGSCECVVRPPLVLKALHSAEDGGLKVSIAADRTRSGTNARFRVLRSATSAIGPDAQELWSGEARIESQSNPEPTDYAIVAKEVDLTPDSSRPFLLVDATSVRSAGPVSCEQPLRQWGQQDLNPERGLHGSYTSAVDAIKRNAAALLALLRTDETIKDEWGFVIVRDLRQSSGGYYTTPPLRTSDTSSGRPLFLGKDYTASFQKAFDRSCENIDDFSLQATVHTHPPNSLAYLSLVNNFTATDFNGGIKLKKQFAQFEAIFMVSAQDRKVRMFLPQVSDKNFSDEELDRSDNKDCPICVGLWNQYSAPERTTEICTYPAAGPGPCR